MHLSGRPAGVRPLSRLLGPLTEAIRFGEPFDLFDDDEQVVAPALAADVPAVAEAA